MRVLERLMGGWHRRTRVLGTRQGAPQQVQGSVVSPSPGLQHTLAYGKAAGQRLMPRYIPLHAASRTVLQWHVALLLC